MPNPHRPLDNHAQTPIYLLHACEPAYAFSGTLRPCLQWHGVLSVPIGHVANLGFEVAQQAQICATMQSERSLLQKHAKGFPDLLSRLSCLRTH
jgi:hypothetical protein